MTPGIQSIAGLPILCLALIGAPMSPRNRLASGFWACSKHPVKGLKAMTSFYDRRIDSIGGATGSKSGGPWCINSTLPSKVLKTVLSVFGPA